MRKSKNDLHLNLYNKKYCNNHLLLKISKKEVKEFQKKHKLLPEDYLLKGKKWELIDDTYYEIPKKLSWNWFRNLKKSIQIIICVLLGGVLVSSVVIPIEILSNQKFSYSLLDDDTYSIKANKSFTVETLNIPSTYKNKKITVIENEGFNKCKIKNLKLPNTINKIGSRAFFSSNLSSVYYNNNIQNFYMTFNDSPVGLEDKVECGENCFGYILNVPSITTKDLIKNSSFAITLKNLDTLGNKISYDIGYCKENEIRTKGEIAITDKEVSKTINAKVHGIFKDAKFKIYDNDIEKYSFTAKNIKVSAPEYNIAPISGSFPVLLFSLQLKEITNNGTIPTYVALERPKSYDWDNLMYNLSYFPNISKEEASSNSNKWKYIKTYVSSYVKDLYEANNNSIFNFFFRDLNSEFVFQSFFCNGVKPENLNLHIYSDGTLTPITFNNLFGVKEGAAKFDPYSKLNEMIADINRAKEYFLTTKKWDYQKLINMITYPSIYEGFEGIDCMQNYALAMRFAFDSSEYQTGRLSAKDNISNVNRNNPEFCNKIINACTIQNTNALLNNLSEEDKIAFKKMFKFSDDIFKESKEKGNEIVMLLGGAWSMEKNNFYAYLKMTMEYYGTTKTDYYYKPHPGHPTALTPERQKQLKQLSSEGYNIKEIEGSIAAEIVLFYEPSLQVSGWPSSTFTSLEDVNKGLALYDCTLANAKSAYSDYYKYIECFYSVSASTPNTYLIEYNDSSEASERAKTNYAKHPTALYLLDKDEFHYYDKDGREVER